MQDLLAKNVGIQSVDWFLGLVWSWALRGRQGVSPPMYPDDLTSFVPAGLAAFGTKLCGNCKTIGGRLFGPAGCVAFGRPRGLFRISCGLMLSKLRGFCDHQLSVEI